MWNLTGDDIQRAKEELRGRRAAIQARYDTELKQLKTDIASLETFERAAVTFVANFKGADGPEPTAADPEPAVETAEADSASEQSSSLSAAIPAEESAEAKPAVGPGLAAAEKNSSRWRIRLSAGEASP